MDFSHSGFTHDSYHLNCFFCAPGEDTVAIIST